MIALVLLLVAVEGRHRKLVLAEEALEVGDVVLATDKDKRHAVDCRVQQFDQLRVLVAALAVDEPLVNVQVGHPNLWKVSTSGI